MLYGAFTTIFSESVNLFPIEINKYFPDENLCKEQISTFPLKNCLFGIKNIMSCMV